MLNDADTELMRLECDCPRERPPNFGLSIWVEPSGSLADFVQAFRQVWRSIARWGRWEQDSLGPWPDEEEFVRSLPTGFSQRLVEGWPLNVSDWITSLHDRDWIVWSVGECGGQIKIDLDSTGMPISTFGVRLAAEVLGARVVGYGGCKPCIAGGKT